MGAIYAGRGDELPVSALPCDGTFPIGTTHWEKRNIATHVPAWDPKVCIQCGKCALVCPHAVIRVKVYDRPTLEALRPHLSPLTRAAGNDRARANTLQVAPEDCTGGRACASTSVRSRTKPRCGSRRSTCTPPTLREPESENWEFFLNIPELDRRKIKVGTIRQQQVQEPLFEFSGACAGCGETPYIKLITQLFGDHAIVANATGCSSIYGGNLPTTP